MSYHYNFVVVVKGSNEQVKVFEYSMFYDDTERMAVADCGHRNLKAECMKLDIRYEVKKVPRWK